MSTVHVKPLSGPGNLELTSMREKKTCKRRRSDQALATGRKQNESKNASVCYKLDATLNQIETNWKRFDCKFAPNLNLRHLSLT